MDDIVFLKKGVISFKKVAFKSYLFLFNFCSVVPVPLVLHPSNFASGHVLVHKMAIINSLISVTRLLLESYYLF